MAHNCVYIFYKYGGFIDIIIKNYDCDNDRIFIF